MAARRRTLDLLERGVISAERAEDLLRSLAGTWHPADSPLPELDVPSSWPGGRAGESQWRGLLHHWNEAIYRTPEVLLRQPEEVLRSDWLGAPPATEEQIAALEVRIGIPLPPTYRAFLRVTNGWRCTGVFATSGGPLRPAEAVDWYRTTLGDQVDRLAEYADVDVPDDEYFVYGDGQDSTAVRWEYLPETLQVGDEERAGGGVYLLNPKVMTGEGEWEAWYLAHWMPGARRYPSFWELMLGECRSFLELRKGPA